MLTLAEKQKKEEDKKVRYAVRKNRDFELDLLRGHLLPKGYQVCPICLVQAFKRVDKIKRCKLCRETKGA